ncbi:nucleotidyltransferase family protein [Methylohalobius crimeensis]|uniref:nucleotidyltransferase family protein n=1 Tax=Methylohalobius crimeensis TaxID=244365 RepID=UPI0003B6CC10|nr:nucleotidyltransferase domain-containing protein [Methylohalobius crimeensis]
MHMPLRPSKALEQHRKAIRQIVARHHAANARIFGSVLKGNDREDSDLDLLVDTTPETTLMDIGAIRLELRNLLGLKVDVLNHLPFFTAITLDSPCQSSKSNT